jgi:hypothetical protein
MRGTPGISSSGWSSISRKSKPVAESTTSIGKLNEIEHYCAHNFVYTRFDYSTGDAAGQNMTSKATFVACEWIREKYPACALPAVGQLRHGEAHLLREPAEEPRQTRHRRDDDARARC